VCCFHQFGRVISVAAWIGVKTVLSSVGVIVWVNFMVFTVELCCRLGEPFVFIPSGQSVRLGEVFVLFFANL